MVHPKKSRSVAIACPEWSSVEWMMDLPKSARSSIRALSMANALLRGETYSEYCSMGTVRGGPSLSGVLGDLVQIKLGLSKIG
jgi:hypothetical protein